MGHQLANIMGTGTAHATSLTITVTVSSIYTASSTSRLRAYHKAAQLYKSLTSQTTSRLLLSCLESSLC